jgi:hypothetical protein
VIVIPQKNHKPYPMRVSKKDTGSNTSPSVRAGYSKTHLRNRTDKIAIILNITNLPVNSITIHQVKLIRMHM